MNKQLRELQAWRHRAETVRDRYDDWATSTLDNRERAYARYVRALNHEESAAHALADA